MSTVAHCVVHLGQCLADANADPIAILGVAASLLGVAATCVVGVWQVWKQKQQQIAFDSNNSSASEGLLPGSPTADDEAVHNAFLMLADHYAKQVSAWFAERFRLLEEFAQTEELQSEDAHRILDRLEELNSKITGVPGGVYALDKNGRVVAQHTPHAPDVPDIKNYDTAEREYWQMSRRTEKPIVCNAFTSANRKKEILVLAARRHTRKGAFNGIVDAVVDIDTSPFSEMAKACLKLQSHIPASVGHKKPGAFRLVLADENKRILGSSDGPVDGRGSLEENPIVQSLFSAKEGRTHYGSRNGAIATVDGTHFFAVLHRRVDRLHD